MNNWRKVVFSCEVDEDTDECPECGGDYVDCPCPGPTQDGIEYKEVDGVLYGRPETIKIICQWCGKVTGEKPADGTEPVCETSTICDKCFEKQIADLPPGEVCLCR